MYWRRLEGPEDCGILGNGINLEWGYAKGVEGEISCVIGKRGHRLRSVTLPLDQVNLILGRCGSLFKGGNFVGLRVNDLD